MVYNYGTPSTYGAPGVNMAYGAAPQPDWNTVFQQYLNQVQQFAPPVNQDPVNQDPWPTQFAPPVNQPPGPAQPAGPNMPPGVTVSTPTPTPGAPHGVAGPTPPPNPGMPSGVTVSTPTPTRGGGKGRGNRGRHNRRRKNQGISGYKFDVMRERMPWLDTHGIDRKSFGKMFPKARGSQIQKRLPVGGGR